MESLNSVQEIVAVDDSNDVSGDDLFVDQLLDFSQGFYDAELPSQKLEEVDEEKDKIFPVSEKPPAPLGNVLSSDTDLDPLIQPVDELESLEWLSHFVEDTFSDFSLTGKLPEKMDAPPQEKETVVSVVQTKARTKRPRAGTRVCPILSSPPADSTTSCSSSSSSSPTSFISQRITSEKPLTKKTKTQPSEDSGATGGQTRKCRHCGVTKTPQWRAGPLGSKTLCNACGVRYKSGRLLPEYRPACSPTFSSELHSNNHRKVMEMRRRKEMGMEAGGEVQVFEFILQVGKRK